MNTGWGFPILLVGTALSLLAANEIRQIVTERTDRRTGIVVALVVAVVGMSLTGYCWEHLVTSPLDPPKFVVRGRS